MGRPYGYQGAMVGRGRYGRRFGPDIMGQLEDAAAKGDPRAQALCDAMCEIPPYMKRSLGSPGVQAPCDDLFPLPFRPLAGTPTFISGGPTTITLTARPQKPFQGERPVSIVTRVGAGAAAIVPVIRGGIRVGTLPQVAQVADMPLEFLDRTSFGVRQQFTPADAGIDIEVDIALVGPALAAGETITVFLTVFGSTFA